MGFKEIPKYSMTYDGFYAFRLWRLVFCMGFKEIPKYSLIFTWVVCTLDDFDCVLHGLLCWYVVVYWMGFIILLLFAYVSMGFIALLIFGCVLHGFYRFVDIWLCIAWVLSLCWYLLIYCMGFILLLIFGCVLHGFYLLVDIWLNKTVDQNIP